MFLALASIAHVAISRMEAAKFIPQTSWLANVIISIIGLTWLLLGIRAAKAPPSQKPSSYDVKGPGKH